MSAVDDTRDVLHEPAMARGQTVDRRFHVPHQGQAGEIRPQVPVRWIDDHRRPVHDMVPGQQGPALLHEPTEVIRGVPGSVDRLQRQHGAASGRQRQRPAPAHAEVGDEVVGRAEAHHPGAGGPGQRGRTWGVVTVGVGHQYPAERAAGRDGGQQRGPVILVVGPGIDHGQLRGADHVAVRPRSGHEPRVGRGEAQEAVAQLHRLARHRCRAHAGIGHRRDRRRDRCELMPPGGGGAGSTLGGPVVGVRRQGDGPNGVVEVFGVTASAASASSAAHLVVPVVPGQQDPHPVPVGDHPRLDGRHRARCALRPPPAARHWWRSG